VAKRVIKKAWRNCWTWSHGGHQGQGIARPLVSCGQSHRRVEEPVAVRGMHNSCRSLAFRGMERGWADSRSGQGLLLKV
jgi:hypothetical protein